MRYFNQIPLAILLFPTIFIHPGCQSSINPSENNVVLVANVGANSPGGSKNDFADYWYKGEAELNSYDIIQSRYGEKRTGEQVMVFVTEDFSKSKHVKLDNPADAGKDKVPVLKLNNIRRFVTGIYDYSMMQSVFTPVDLKAFPHSLKTTTTSQDWCGHTFIQINLNSNSFNISGSSYFEKEGDEDYKVVASMLEDELWARLRINPKSIPEGEMDIIPSTFYGRLQHEQLKPKRARVRFEKREAMSYLVVEYLHLDRTLSIGFEPEFPFKILGWVEKKGNEIMSKGELKNSIKSAYWEHHSNADEPLRNSLQLN